MIVSAIDTAPACALPAGRRHHRRCTLLVQHAIADPHVGRRDQFGSHGSLHAPGPPTLLHAFSGRTLVGPVLLIPQVRVVPFSSASTTEGAATASSQSAASSSSAAVHSWTFLSTQRFFGTAFR